MKRSILLLPPLLLLVLLLALAVPGPALADEPARTTAPYLYAMVKCSGLSVAQLEYGQQQFDTDYGWAHQLTTPEQWKLSYHVRANEFAASVGCTAPLVEDGTALTFWYRLYVPTYERILRNVPE